MAKITKKRLQEAITDLNRIPSIFDPLKINTFLKQHQNNPAKIYVAVKDDMMIARGIMENNMDVLRQYEVGFWITENMYCVDDNNEDLIRSVAEGSDVENCIVHLQVGIRDFIKSIESFTANLQK